MECLVLSSGSASVSSSLLLGTHSGKYQGIGPSWPHPTWFELLAPELDLFQPQLFWIFWKCIPGEKKSTSASLSLCFQINELAKKSFKI